MKTLKEYAEERQLSYEAIRRQVDRHQDELKDHIITKKDGKKTVRYLDEEGEMILNRIRGDNAMVNIQAGKTKELEDLRQENQVLKDNIRELQATIIKDHEQYMDLQARYIGLLEAPKDDRAAADQEPATDQEAVDEPVKTEEAPATQEDAQDAPGSTEEAQADNSTPEETEAPQGPQEAQEAPQATTLNPSSMTFGQKLKFLFGK